MLWFLLLVVIMQFVTVDGRMKHTSFHRILSHIFSVPWHFLIWFVFVFCCLFVCNSAHTLRKGEFEKPGAFLGGNGGDIFPQERLKSFRGGFDRGGQTPDRSRRPQPDYDNYAYAAPNFFQHELVYLEDNLILDFQPSTGEVIWVFVCAGVFDFQFRFCFSIEFTKLFDILLTCVLASLNGQLFLECGLTVRCHKLVYIGCSGPGGKMFDYDVREGSYKIFRFNHKAEAGEDPMM